MMFLLAVTVVSMLLAAIMSAIAWRIAGDERRRSEARVAALAADIRADDDGGLTYDADPIVSPIFEARPSSTNSRPFAIVAGGALVFAAAITVVVVSTTVSSRRFSGPSAATTVSTATAAPAPNAASPLELLALGDERAGDALTVRGIVRNPADGASVGRLTAVVLLFTPDGGFLDSGRAELDAASLRPGGESTFAITVPRAAGVARYRVSFRTDDRVVPHLDRRHES
jgi:hypothetical protein